MTNIPTIIPKTVMPSQYIPRRTQNSAGTRTITTLDDSSENDINVNLKLPSAEQRLEVKVDCEEKERELKDRVAELEQMLKESKFSIDRFKHNQAHFRLYTGFDSYDLF